MRKLSLITNVAGARAQIKHHLKFILNFSFSPVGLSLFSSTRGRDLVTRSGHSSGGQSPRLGVA